MSERLFIVFHLTTSTDLEYGSLKEALHIKVKVILTRSAPIKSEPRERAR